MPAKLDAPDSLAVDEIEVRVIRSARRKKTISARLLNWHTLEVRAPLGVSESDLQRHIEELKRKALRQQRRLRNLSTDAELQKRAVRLNEALFGGTLRWRSIRFVGNQNTCFGSCTPGRGTLRISDRLAQVPDFVLDYVIVHELAHLLVPNHTRPFWDLVYRYERTERARGYLMALQMESDESPE
ncbi:MAG: M48 metallopeptidase family protein [Anaerolineae bacterium]